MPKTLIRYCAWCDACFANFTLIGIYMELIYQLREALEKLCFSWRYGNQGVNIWQLLHLSSEHPNVRIVTL